MTPCRSARTAVAALAVLVLGLAAGCGLAEDDGPEALAVENVPYGLLDPDAPPATVAPPRAGTETVEVYFVSDDGTRLVPTSREVDDQSDVRQRLRALLEQPPTSEEVDDGLTTLIPSETALNDVEVIEGTGEAVIDLSREFFELSQGDGQRTAYAQITCTATDTPSISRVSYVLDGEPVAALVADGTTKDGPVSCRQDYLGYRLPDPPSREPEPTPGDELPATVEADPTAQPG